MKRAAVKIARALHDYARSRGWAYTSFTEPISENGYRIDMSANSNIGRFYVNFAAAGFRGQDEFERFAEVERHLDEQSRDEPGLSRAVSLVIQDPEQYEHWGAPGLGRHDVPIDDWVVEAALS